jgi:hypothetical protein
MHISELAQALSKATNETWLPHSIDGGEMVLYCTSLDHEEMLYIRAEKGRLHIWGSLNGLHKFIPYKAEQPKITADINKTPYVIARDIARRLLPDYRSLLGICMERKQANDEYQ